jgi:predicted HD phosphohydrolase
MVPKEGKNTDTLTIALFHSIGNYLFHIEEESKPA